MGRLALGQSLVNKYKHHTMIGNSGHDTMVGDFRERTPGLPCRLRRRGAAPAEGPANQVVYLCVRHIDRRGRVVKIQIIQSAGYALPLLGRFV